jgi:hypothetical protein
MMRFALSRTRSRSRRTGDDDGSTGLPALRIDQHALRGGSLDQVPSEPGSPAVLERVWVRGVGDQQHPALRRLSVGRHGRPIGGAHSSGSFGTWNHDLGFRMGYSLGSTYHFLSGAAMMGCVVAGMFFFRFWSKTQDRLFGIFGWAFWIMAIERGVLISFKDFDAEDHAYVYVIRLTAFVLILLGVWDKNRGEKP